MEKMHVSSPVAKQPRTAKTPALSPLRRSESVNLSNSNTLDDMGEEKSRRTAATLHATTSSPNLSQDQTTRHPRGHKVKTLDEIWKAMDSQDFLRLTDTLALNDVWVQPVAVEEYGKGAVATVRFREIVDAPHIKAREVDCTFMLDDLLKMLYLNDCLQWDMQNEERPSYDDWLKEKSAACVRAKGIDTDRVKLCSFIINEDERFSFFPEILHGRYGIFFRKICYHSYRSDDKTKFVNPAMIKCKAAKGSFEYIIEARVFPLPFNYSEMTCDVVNRVAVLKNRAAK